MHKEGHAGAALLAYAPLGFSAFYSNFEQAAILGLVVTVACASLPDVDLEISQVKHRGITHTLWFALFIGGITAIAGAYVGMVLGDGSIVTVVLAAGFGFLTGSLCIMSHILTDWITPMGVEPFRPINVENYSLGLVKSKSQIANYGLFILGTGLTLAMLVFGGVT